MTDWKPLFLTHVSQALGDSDFASVLQQLLPLMKPCSVKDGDASCCRSGEDECGPDELILLLVYLYSLADEAQEGEDEELEKLERELIGALTLVLIRERDLSPLVQKLTGKRRWSVFTFSTISPKSRWREWKEWGVLVSTVISRCCYWGRFIAPSSHLTSAHITAWLLPVGLKPSMQSSTWGSTNPSEPFFTHFWRNSVPRPLPVPIGMLLFKTHGPLFQRRASRPGCESWF